MDGEAICETENLSYTFDESVFADSKTYVLSVYAKGYNNFDDGEKTEVNFENVISQTKSKVEITGGSIANLLAKGYTAYAVNGEEATTLGTDMIADDGSLKIDLAKYSGQRLAIVANYSSQDESICLYSMATISEGTISVVCNEVFPSYTDTVAFRIDLGLADGLYVMMVSSGEIAVKVVDGEVIAIEEAINVSVGDVAKCYVAITVK